MLPEAGGYYVYARRAFGDGVGFAVGWTDWITYCAVLGYVSIAIGEFAALLLPVPAGYEKAIAILALAALAALQLAGLRVSSRFQEITTVVKFGAFLTVVVAAMVFALKVIFIPRVLHRARRYVGADVEIHPFINTPMSVLLAGILTLVAYAVAEPVVALTDLPTRASIPLALAVVFVGLFVIVSRRSALTQIVGFLVMENGIALLAVMATYGVPFIVELGVFLDVLLGFLVMQVFLYRIRETFATIDVDQLRKLRH